MVQRLSGVAIVVASITTLSLHVHAREPVMKIGPLKNVTRVGSIEERYQSYNIEMLEVTGGMFWKPYASNDRTGGALDKSGVPAGMDADLYEYLPPIDLSNGKLRKLAAALGPAYVRVSGTWANTTYFADLDSAPSSPPSGFAGVLNRDRWKGVADFAAATDARIVTSMAISPGVRDAAGVWMPGQAKEFLDYTRSVGGDIAAAEFMNEPTMATMGGAPKGYDAVAFGRDYELFATFARQAAPGMRILGPGSVGETTASDVMIHYGSQGVIATRDMLRQMGNDIDAFSYHHYGAASQRCAERPACRRRVRMRRSPKSGSPGPTRRSPSTAIFVTSSRPESRCGLPRPPMRPAAEILGLPPFWIRSAISTSWAAWPSRASRW